MVQKNGPKNCSKVVQQSMFYPVRLQRLWLNLFILVSMPYYMISFASRLVGMITSLFRSEIFPLCTFTFCSTERL